MISLLQICFIKATIILEKVIDLVRLLYKFISGTALLFSRIADEVSRDLRLFLIAQVVGMTVLQFRRLECTVTFT